MAKRTVRWSAVACTSVALSVSGSLAAPYSPAGAFARPGDDSVTWDVLSDGRLIAIDGTSVLLQDAVNASSYSIAGSIPSGLINGSASFVEVSPDGATLAFGDNNFGAASNPRVHFLDMASLDPGTPSSVTSVGAANFQASWVGSTLFVSGTDAFGAPSRVTRIDAASLGSLTAEVAISNIGGSSGGVTSVGGVLLTSNGFDNGPGGSSTGTIRAFDLDTLDFGDVAVDFEADGTTIAEVLSGSPLGVDHLGNLIVGGGDYDQPDHGYAGVVDAGAILTAISGGPSVPGSAIQALSPGGAFDFYSIKANAATGEVLVTYFGDPTVYRYAIPAPAGGAILALALTGAARRRRRVA